MPQELTPDSFMTSVQAKPPAVSSVDTFMQGGGLPHPDMVDQQTTLHAETLAERITRPDYGAISRQMEANPPGVPMRPAPVGLTAMGNRAVPVSGGGVPVAPFGPGSFVPTPSADANSGAWQPIQSAQQMGTGLLDMVNNSPVAAGSESMSPNPDVPGNPTQMVGGASNAFRGGLGLVAPAMAPALAATPVKTGLSLVAGMATQEGVEAGLKKLGLPKEWAAFAGDMTGLIAGIKTHAAAEKLKPRIEAKLKARAEAKAQPPATSNSVGAEPYQPADLTPEKFMAQTAPQEKAHVQTQAPAETRPAEQPRQSGGVPETASPQTYEAGQVETAKQESADAHTSFASAPHSAPIEPSATVPNPEPEPRTAGATTLASGFGALQPYYESLAKSLQESAAEVKALHAKRTAALEAIRRDEATDAQKEEGRTVRQSMTGERDLWGARVNQVISKLKRLVPDHTEQEALSLMRDFKSRPGELEQFALGTHPDLAKLDPADFQTAMGALDKIRPSIAKALNPTPKMQVADQVLTHIADLSLKEGQRVGFLESSIAPDEYVTHLLHPKGEGETAGRASSGQFGRAIAGKFGRNFSFAKERKIPTLAHAVAYGLKPKTLNAFDAFTIHGDKFATARATHMLVQDLKDAGAGKWGARSGEGNIPENWVEVAPHAHPFQNMRAFTDTEGNPQIARQTLFVPKHLADALKPLTDPDYMNAVAGYRKVRVWQAAAKAAELSLSVFHLKAENYMALSNMGMKGWLAAQRADRWSDPFLEAERDMILHGGTSSIQGRTFEAYKSLQPGSIPTYLDMMRKMPGIKQFDQAAGKLTDFIFDNQVRKFKVTNYAIRKAGWLAENPNASAAEYSKAMHSVASEINAVYGGLHWENLGVNRMTQNAARFLMLAPDWTFSNFFNAATIAEGGFKGGGLKGKTEGAKMSRAFWTRAILGGLAMNQGYSLLVSGQPSKNPIMAYEGKDQQGREIYRNVAFAGAPSDVVNLVGNMAHYGVPAGVVKSLVGKTAPGFRTAFELAFNEDFRHHAITKPEDSFAANTTRGAWHLTKGLLPIPFTATNLIDVAKDGDADEKEKAKDLIGLIIFGQASRHVAPEGMKWSPAHGLQPKREKEQKPFWEQVTAQ